MNLKAMRLIMDDKLRRTFGNFMKIIIVIVN